MKLARLARAWLAWLISRRRVRVRSVSWTALFVPLLFSSIPAAARERPVERVSRKRTLHVSATPGEVLPELYVAGGNATVITTEGALGAGGPSLQDEGGSVRLVPVDGSSFIILPFADVSEGRHLELTVPLRSGEPHRLALVTRRGEVDGEVWLVRSQGPVADEDVSGVARLLQAAPVGQVGFTQPKEWVRLREDLQADVESVLRIGQHVFITLSVPIRWKLKPSARDWNRLLLRASLEDGSSVVLPRLHVPAFSSQRKGPQHTLVAILPVGTLRLSLKVDGADVPGVVLTPP